MNGLVVDLFCGGGGVAVGLRAALEREVDIGINHSPVAIAVHEANHPRTRHYTTDVYDVDPRNATGGRRVGVLWLSPDCRHFSSAKGGKPVSKKIRSLAWIGIRWAKDVRPDVIFLENVPEFKTWGPLDRDGIRIDARKGETFRRWVAQLRRLGYVVDWRVLDSSHYGAPTRRRRLFVVARRDGQPIRWPRQTHGLGGIPLRTAAECIDWTIPVPSIFGRKRPLAEKTMWRIAQGVRKFVFETSQPFIVEYHSERPGERARVSSLAEPLPTQTTEPRFGLCAPTLIQTGYGERPGQAARVPGLHKPLGTLVDGQKHALVAAWLVKHYGGEVGHELTRPTGTITARDHHGLGQATLFPSGGDIDRPFRVPEVRAFLTAYFGTDGNKGKGQTLLEPMRTLTRRHRLGLVTVAGAEYQIGDIGLRMLKVPELLRAQFGKYAAGYDLSAAETQEAQVELIGNSVPPEVVEALVRANIPGRSVEQVA